MIWSVSLNHLTCGQGLPTTRQVSWMDWPASSRRSRGPPTMKGPKGPFISTCHLQHKVFYCVCQETYGRNILSN